jgi:hypothetical protein
MFSSKWLSGRPALMPLTAALILLVIVAAVWLVRSYNQSLRDRNQQMLIAQELTDLNSPANLQTTPPEMSSVMLAPLTVRSAESAVPSVPASSKNVLELQLLWARPEVNQNLQATVGHIGEARLTIPNLKVETIAGRKTIRIRLPGHLLTRGLYQIIVTSASGDLSQTVNEEYVLRVN